MRLTKLSFDGTVVADLAPLKGMPLTVLSIPSTKASDLSPLRGMPLKALIGDFKPERDGEVLRPSRRRNGSTANRRRTSGRKGTKTSRTRSGDGTWAYHPATGTPKP